MTNHTTGTNDDNWPKLVAEAPPPGEYETSITRQIPVFMLTRRD